MTVALAFSGVSKRFIIQHERPESFQERFVQLYRRHTPEEFWALRDVSFAVADGETFGIVGRNGAGKSTILKLAIGILKPDRGTIARRRRAYAMLELGAGFHPELSGRDNIFLNGSLHGLKRAQMRRLFDQIVAFAELERFIDTPVKHYSSGMFMRLGFATAIHMQPELLVIDEILAVGDVAFQRKCGEALWGLRRQGVTILFVSHSQEAVYHFCDRALLLSHGQVVAIGTVEEVNAAYVRLVEAETEGAPALPRARPTVRAVAALDADGRETLTVAPGKPCVVEVALQVPFAGAALDGEVTLRTETGTPIVTASLPAGLRADAAGLRRLRATFAALPLCAGRLRLAVRLTVTPPEGDAFLVEHEAAHSLTVGDHAHGPLLAVPHRWEDRTDPVRPAPLNPPNAGGTLLPPLQEAPQDWGVGGPTPPPVSRYLAEGYTGGIFDTYLLLVNPSERPLDVAADVAYAEGSGGAPGFRACLAPWAARTLSLNGLLGAGKEFALRLRADRPFQAARAVAFDRYPAIGGLVYTQTPPARLEGIAGGHVAAAAAAAAPEWFFADGYTGDGFETYFAIANPSAAPARLQLTYYRSDGEPVARALTVPAGRRVTVAVHGEAAQGGIGSDQTFGTHLRVLEGEGIVAERVVYFRYFAVDFEAGGGTATAGAIAPARQWHFAGGSTRPGFDPYVAIVNPTGEPAAVTLTYCFEDERPPVERRLTVPPRRRATVLVWLPSSDAYPGGLGRDAAHALRLASTAPVVAEQTTYFRFTDGAGGLIDGGHALVGTTRPLRPGARALLVGGGPGAILRRHLAVFNPGGAAAAIDLTVQAADGRREARRLTVPPGRRLTVALAGDGDATGAAPDTAAAPALVEVVEAGDEGVVVEQAGYFRTPGGATGGSALAAVPLDEG